MIPMLDHLSDTAKHWIDALSLGALLATFLNIVPAVTAVLVLIWTAMRIYESLLAIRVHQKKLRDE